MNDEVRRKDSMSYMRKMMLKGFLLFMKNMEKELQITTTNWT